MKTSITKTLPNATMEKYPTLETIVKEVSEKIGMETELYTSRKGSRALMGIKTDNGFDACVDIDFIVKQITSENELLDALVKAAEKSVSERDKSRRYVKGEEIDFSGYFPPEAQETPIIDEKQNAFEEYDEDRAC